jgi:hypothetical protein
MATMGSVSSTMGLSVGCNRPVGCVINVLYHGNIGVFDCINCIERPV